MNAQELTVIVRQLSNKVIDLEKQTEYLTSELEKQRLIISDLSIDVKMIGGDISK